MKLSPSGLRYLLFSTSVLFLPLLMPSSWILLLMMFVEFNLRAKRPFFNKLAWARFYQLIYCAL